MDSTTLSFDRALTTISFGPYFIVRVLQTNFLPFFNGTVIVVPLYLITIESNPEEFIFITMAINPLSNKVSSEGSIIENFPLELHEILVAKRIIKRIYADITINFAYLRDESI